MLMDSIIIIIVIIIIMIMLIITLIMIIKDTFLLIEDPRESDWRSV
jgi:hypothetical protein